MKKHFKITSLSLISFHGPVIEYDLLVEVQNLEFELVATLTSQVIWVRQLVLVRGLVHYPEANDREGVEAEESASHAQGLRKQVFHEVPVILLT